MGIELKCQANYSIPLVRLDPASIKRMLNNLIWNAMEACSKDTCKKEHVVTVRVDYYDKDHFMFEVEDNGIGMEQEEYEKLFNECFTTKGGSGTGLGLMVVNKIVKEHSGRVEVMSALGTGSTFRVIFGLN